MGVNCNIFTNSHPPTNKHKASNCCIRTHLDIVSNDGISQYDNEIPKSGICTERNIVLKKTSLPHLHALGTINLWQKVHEPRTLLNQGLRKSTAFQRIA